MAIYNLLSTNGFLMCNKAFGKFYENNTALVLAELCSCFEYFNGKEFFIQLPRLEFNTNLSAHQIRKAMECLESLGILSVTKKGLPAKNWYFINEKTLLEVMNNCTLRFQEALIELNQDYADVQNIDNQLLKSLTTRDLKIEPQLINHNNKPNNIISLSTSNLNSDSTRESDNLHSFVTDSLSESTTSENSEIPFSSKKCERKSTKSSESNKRSSSKQNDSFPKAYYDQCFETYKQCYEKLRASDSVFGTYYAPLKTCNSRLKHWFEVFGLEKTLEGIRNASQDDFCVKTLGYNFLKILSEGVFPDRVNKVNNSKCATSSPKKMSAIERFGKQDYSKGWFDD